MYWTIFSLSLRLHEGPTATMLVRTCSVVYLGDEYHNIVNNKFSSFGKKDKESFVWGKESTLIGELNPVP